MITTNKITNMAHFNLDRYITLEHGNVILLSQLQHHNHRRRKVILTPSEFDDNYVNLDPFTIKAREFSLPSDEDTQSLFKDNNLISYSRKGSFYTFEFMFYNGRSMEVRNLNFPAYGVSIRTLFKICHYFAYIQRRTTPPNQCSVGVNATQTTLEGLHDVFTGLVSFPGNVVGTVSNLNSITSKIAGSYDHISQFLAQIKAKLLEAIPSRTLVDNIYDLCVGIVFSFINRSFAGIIQAFTTVCLKYVSLSLIEQFRQGLDQLNFIEVEGLFDKFSMKYIKDNWTSLGLEIPTYVAAFVLFLVQCIIGKDFGLTSLFNVASLIGRGCKGISDFGSMFTTIWDKCDNHICRKLYGMDRTQMVNLERYPDMAEIFSLCDVLRKDGNVKSNMYQSKQLAQVVLIVQQDINKFYDTATAYKDTPISLRCKEYKRDLASVFETAHEAVYVASGSRNQPVCILLHGKSGVGKTGMYDALCKDLSRNYYNSAPVDEITYSRKVENEFWDGYKSCHKITKYDDAFQIADSATKPNPEFMEIIRACNTDSWQLHMATIKDKTDSYFRSDFVIVTSNLSDMKPKSLVCPDAVKRRIDIKVEVTVKKEFLTPQGIISRFAVWLKNNPGKTLEDYKQSIVSNEVTHVIDTDIYALNCVYKDVDDSEVVTTMTYDEFLTCIDMCHKRYANASNDPDMFTGIPEKYLSIGQVEGGPEDLQAFQRTILDIDPTPLTEPLLTAAKANVDEVREGIVSSWYSFLSAGVNNIFDYFRSHLYSLLALVATLGGYYLYNRTCRLESALIRGRSLKELSQAKLCSCELCASYKMLAITNPKNIKVFFSKLIILCQSKKISLSNNILHSYFAGDSLPIGNFYAPSQEEILPKVFTDKVDDDMTHLLAQLDTVTENLIKKVLLKNLVKVCTNGLRMNGLVLRGRLVLVPRHFADAIDSNIDVISMYERGATPVTVSVLSKRDVKRGGNTCDLTVIELGANFIVRPDITQSFPKAGDISSLAGFMEGGELRLIRNELESVKGTQFLYAMQEPATFKQIDTITTGSRNGVEYNTLDAIRTVCNSRAGDCGSPLVLFNKNSRAKIVGIHTSGIQHGTFKEAISQPVTYEDLMEAIGDRKGVVSVTLEYEPTTSPIPNTLGITTVTPVGMPKNSSFEKSALSGVFEQKVDLSDLSRDALLRNSMKFAKNVEHLDEGLLDICQNDITNILVGKTNSDTVKRILTNEESIAGIHDCDYIDGLNRRTSPGYPYSLKKGNTPGKSLWLGNQGNYKIDAGLMTDMTVIEDLAMQGMVDPTKGIFTASLKDERRTFEKIEAGKTRVFTAGNMALTALIRKYTLGFVKHIMHNRIDNEIGLGINCYSTDWPKLRRFLLSKGSNVIAGDFSNFDGSLNAQILERIPSIITQFYGDEHLLTRQVLLNYLFNFTCVFEGKLVQFNHSQPSGNPLTTVINCIYNMFIFRYIYMLWQKDTKQTVHLGSYRQHLAGVYYGDDSIIGISSDIIDTFNQITITKYMAMTGHVYTDETKSTSVLKAKTLEEVTFLKRSFRLLDGEWISPLERDSIETMVMWKRKDLTNDAMFEAVIPLACLEAYLHGPEYYNYFVSKLRATGINLPIRSPLECKNFILEQREKMPKFSPRVFTQLEGEEDNKLLTVSGRLDTFDDWPVPYIKPMDLAEAGLFYLGRHDHVECIYCHGRIGEWEVGDVPVKEHKKHFPNCNQNVEFCCDLKCFVVPSTHVDGQACSVCKCFNFCRCKCKTMQWMMLGRSPADGACDTLTGTSQDGSLSSSSLEFDDKLVTSDSLGDSGGRFKTFLNHLKNTLKDIIASTSRNIGVLCGHLFNVVRFLNGQVTKIAPYLTPILLGYGVINVNQIYGWKFLVWIFLNVFWEEVFKRCGLMYGVRCVDALVICLLLIAAMVINPMALFLNILLMPILWMTYKFRCWQTPDAANEDKNSTLITSSMFSFFEFCLYMANRDFSWIFLIERAAVGVKHVIWSNESFWTGIYHHMAWNVSAYDTSTGRYGALIRGISERYERNALPFGSVIPHLKEEWNKSVTASVVNKFVLFFSKILNNTWLRTCGSKVCNTASNARVMLARSCLGLECAGQPPILHQTTHPVSLGDDDSKACFVDENEPPGTTMTTINNDIGDRIENRSQSSPSIDSSMLDSTSFPAAMLSTISVLASYQAPTVVKKVVASLEGEETDVDPINSSEHREGSVLQVNDIPGIETFGLRNAIADNMYKVQDQDLTESLSRQIEVANGTWTTSDAEIATTLTQAQLDDCAKGKDFKQPFLHELEFPKAILDQSEFIVNKLSNVAYIRADVEITLKVQATPFVQGALLLWCTPYANSIENQRSSLNEHLRAITAFPNVELNLQSPDRSVTFKIPFTSEFNMINPNDKPSLADVRLSVLSKLEGGDTAVKANYTILARLVNTQLYGHSPNLATKVGHKIMTTLEGEDEKASKQGIISGISNTIAKVADGVGALGIPEVASIAKPVGWIARAVGGIASFFGFSKSTDLSKNEIITNVPARGFTHSEGIDTGVPLSLLPDNQIKPVSSTFSSEDEMSIKYIGKRKYVLGRINWTDSQANKTVLAEIPVNPANFSTFGAYRGGRRAMFTGPAGYVTSQFGWWRGEMELQVKFAKTQFHQGRLLFQYLPFGSGAQPLESVLSQIVDISQVGDKGVTIAFPSVYPLKWFQSSDWIEHSYATVCTPGVVVVSVLTPLVAAPTVSSSVRVYAWQSWKNLEVAEPGSSLRVYTIDNKPPPPPKQPVVPPSGGGIIDLLGSMFDGMSMRFESEDPYFALSQTIELARKMIHEKYTMNTEYPKNNRYEATGFIYGDDGIIRYIQAWKPNGDEGWSVMIKDNQGHALDQLPLNVMYTMWVKPVPNSLLPWTSPIKTELEGEMTDGDKSKLSTTMGEVVVSLRALSRRFTPSGVTSFPISLPTVVWGTKESARQSQAYLISWLYRFNQGSLRHKVLCNEGIAYVSIGNGTNKATYGQDFDTTNAMHLQPMDLNPILECTTPYYCPTEIVAVGSKTFGTGNNDLQLSQATVYNYQAITGDCIRLDATGDDHTFSFLIGPPAFLVGPELTDI